MFEKIIKFGCGFIVIFFVVMICIAMCSAYFATNKASSTPEITMMSSPSQSSRLKTYWKMAAQ